MSSSENDNECFICWSPLTKEHGKKALIHKYDKTNANSEKWEHACHEKCLNTWSRQCITSETERRYPKCPICNDFKIPINKIPVSLRAKALEILEEEDEEILVIEEDASIEVQDLEEDKAVIEAEKIAKAAAKAVRQLQK